MPQMSFKQWQKAEASARHGLFTFLILFTLVNLDIMARKTKKEQEKATQTWVAWGVTFVLLAFFIITPEQELLQSRR
ncbi:hypothetical protein [Alicyclobacillus mengziensis]|uniref:Uncharacterized protein n=1 Tax=Alicyclobacillus mengziensis TaxID=2931921 RepID=A0A9X7W0Q0_9BACL|nr:hypothetical protein [Alicyclobacillus mengziensis]QSO48045.1 hypothetical protein JZ786_03170 [Alicyclobacillus mengziensis]